MMRFQKSHLDPSIPRPQLPFHRHTTVPRPHKLTMTSSHPLRLISLAEFKPTASSRAWVSIPNPNSLPLLATATSDKSVRVYSLKNFTLHSVLDGGHSRSVRSVAWKPEVRNNGKMCLATGSFDSNMAIWKREEGQSANAARETHIEHGEEDTEYEITGAGTKKAAPRLMSGGGDSDDGDGDDWEFVVVLEGHDSEIKHVSYSPSGQYLASCSRDKSVWIWEEIGDDGDDEWETVAVLQDHSADVKCVSWRPDDGNGEVLASGSYDNDVRFYRGDGDGEWSCVAVLEGHTETVWSLDWEPEVSMDVFNPKADGDYAPRIPRFMSASADHTVRIWKQAPTPPQPNRPSYVNSGIPSTMRPGPANETWGCVATLPEVHDLPIYSVSWSKKSGRVASTGGDSKVAVYEEVKLGRSSVGGEVETEWRVVAILEGGHGPYEINHVTWCPRYDAGRREEGEEMLVTTGDDGSVRAWAIESTDNGQEALVPMAGDHVA